MRDNMNALTDSQELVNDYYWYEETNEGQLSGVNMLTSETHVHIIQELDEEDEPDKYVIDRSELTEDEWTKFIAFAEKYSN